MAETGDDDSMENGTLTNPARQTSNDAFSLAMDAAEDSAGVPTSSNPKEAALPKPGVVHVSGAAPQGKARALSQRRVLGQSEDAKAVADPAFASVASGTIDRPLRTSLEQVDAPLEPTYEFVQSSAMKQAPEQAPLAAEKSAAAFDGPLQRSLQDLEAPAEPALDLVQGPTTDDQGKASAPASPTKRSESSGAATRPNRRDSGDRPSRRADAKATLREEMNILRSQGQSQTPGAVAVTGVVSSGTAQASPRLDAKSAHRAEVNALRQNHAADQAPGAVSVSGLISSGTARATPRGVGKAAIQQEMNPDAKSALRAEVSALRQNHAGSQAPGAVSVSGVISSGTASATPRANGKAALKQEMNALKSNADMQKPGAHSVSGVISSGTACATPRANGKAAIKQEMNALKNNADMQKPGAHSVSGTTSSDGNAASRTDRASRKATRYSVSLKKDPSKKGLVAVPEKGDLKQAPDVKQAPRSSGDQKPGATKESGPSNFAKGNGVVMGKPSLDGGMSKEKSKEGFARPSTDDMSKEKNIEDVGRSSDLLKQVSNEYGLEKENLRELEDENCMVSAQVIDEDELEAEYQAKMMMNAVAAEVVTKDELKGQRSGSRCRNICCPLILIAVVLAIVLPLTNKPDPAPAPTPSPTVTDYDYLYDLFYPISREALLNETTPQFQALNWLANEDPAMLPFQRSNSSTLVERYAAAVFYYSTGGPQWTNQLDFLSNHSICDWGIESLGVVCDETTDHVVKLVMSNNNINGTLPSELSALSRLEGFACIGGNLSGTIPSEVGNLFSLRTFQIGQNPISGTLPSSLTRLTNLEIVNLFSNRLSGTLPKGWLEEAKNMQFLILADNNFEGTLPPFYRQSGLKWIFMDKNRFEGPLPPTLFQQPALQRLDLSINRLNGTIPQTIVALGELQFFHARENEFSGTIPANLGSLDQLEELFLNGNRFIGSIPSEFANLDDLRTLDLSANQLTGSLPEELFETGIVTLNVASNGLTGDIPASFAEFNSLSTFSLQNTSIAGGLESAFCNRSLTTQIASDCAGESPEIECDCCSTCCDGDDCNISVPNICATKKGRFELVPGRGASCSCSQDGTELSCADTACESCNLDESVCVISKDYGYTFNETTGSKTSFRSVLQYVKGRNDTIIFSQHSGPNSCEVSVNGELCRYCGERNCDSGLTGFRVECDNLEGGYRMESCQVVDSRGFLDAFYLTDLSLLSGCAPMLQIDPFLIRS